MVKKLPAVQETWFNPWVGKIPWKRKWLPSPVFLPEESHRQMKPGRLQSMRLQRDTTEPLTLFPHWASNHLQKLLSKSFCHFLVLVSSTSGNLTLAVILCICLCLQIWGVSLPCDLNPLMKQRRKLLIL